MSLFPLYSTLILLILIQYNFIQALQTQQCKNDTTPPSLSSAQQHTLFNSSSPPSFPIHCQCHPHDGTGARIAYLLTLHNRRTLDDAKHLLKSIAAPGNIILIHIDTKLDWTHYEMSALMSFVEDRECSVCGADVLVESLFDIKWGSWSMNDPTHWSMHQLVTNPRFADRWDTYINLSADSLPVYTPQILSRLFDPNTNTTVDHDHNHGSLYGLNFVTTSSCPTGLRPTNIYDFPEGWHKRAHYSHHRNGTRHDTDLHIRYYDSDDGGKSSSSFSSTTSQKIVIYFGSQWMMLTASFIKYLVQALNNEYSLPSMVKRELIRKGKLMTDETFIPTILSNHETFKDTLPDGIVLKSSNSDGNVANYMATAVRYERMDEHMPTAYGKVPDDQRYSVPISSGVDTPRPWGPYYLGVYDLANIRDSGAIFIRKVTKAIDPNILHLLPVDSRDQIPNIQWPKEVNIINKPNWGRFQNIVAKN